VNLSGRHEFWLGAKRYLLCRAREARQVQGGTLDGSLGLDVINQQSDPRH